MFPERLETERLTLARPRPGDGQAYRDAAVGSLDELAEWLRWADLRKRLRDLDDFEDRVGELSRSWDEDSRWHYFVWQDGTMLGEIAFADEGAWESHRVLEYSVWMRTDRAGQGFASEASHAALEVAFEGLGVSFVEALCHPRNGRSRRLLLALGFALSGKHKEFDRLALFPFAWSSRCRHRTLRHLRATDHPLGDS